MNENNQNLGGPGAIPGGEPGSNGSGMITLLLILSDEKVRASTRAALEGLPGVELVGERSELRSGLLLARQLRPRVVLLDLPDINSDEALSAAGAFKLDAPDIALFLMSNTLDPQVLLKAIRSGAQEVLKKPL